MTTTSDPNHPGINKPKGEGEQNEAYLVLSEEERAKGFVRPVRLTYKHVGIRPDPNNELRDLAEEEKERYNNEVNNCGYVKYEVYPDGSVTIGRYWTEDMLNSGCGTVTKMAVGIAETYARDPSFYGATWCYGCKRHISVGEFVWEGTDQRVGS